MKCTDNMFFWGNGNRIERSHAAGRSTPKRKLFKLRSPLRDEQRERCLNIPRDALNPKCGLMVPKFDEVDQVALEAPLLAKREWRSLSTAKMKGVWHQDSNGQTWYRLKFGTKLQKVVSPDNETLAPVIDCLKIKRNLIFTNRPSVQIIAAELLFNV